MIQTPEPGRRLLKHAGDTITFTLSLDRPEPGAAWLRTNLGHADKAREEIIEQTASGRTRPHEDWHDLPMRAADNGVFQITLPLFEPGRFQAKTFFLPQGGDVPIWPHGANTIMHVEPAAYSCGNTLYNAFVRQFGQTKSSARRLSARIVESIDELDDAGYAVIPPSGLFRDLIKELPFIIDKLHCRLIMLLPIHPVPSVFGRMGRFGSPYAALDFFQIDPALAEFDETATPTDQFIELVNAIHSRGAKLLLDIAINHTGWASAIHRHHPEWLKRDQTGRILSPGAWGVTWSDLTELDHSRKEVWQYFAEVLLSWRRLGADGFRCDAGYMIPCAAWEYITARVRREFPDTLFLLEGLGGELSVTRDLLDRGNLNMAYSELFQNYTREQVESCLLLNFDIAQTDGMQIHFAETHDNNRIAAHSHPYARLRVALSAMASTHGAFGFANGVEWYAQEKIDVHEAPSLNWGAKLNQVAHLSRLNAILAAHPAFHHHAEATLVTKSAGAAIALYRIHQPSGRKLMVLTNLDNAKPSTVSWPLAGVGIGDRKLVDLITGRDFIPAVKDGVCSCALGPAETLCLSTDTADLDAVAAAQAAIGVRFPALEHQRLRAKALEALACRRALDNLGDFEPDQLAQKLAADPLVFCQSLTPGHEDPRVTTWTWPEDQRRKVMIPPEHFLLVRAAHPFVADLARSEGALGSETSFHCSSGFHFALFRPHPTSAPFGATLSLAVFEGESTLRATGPVLFLPQPENNLGELRIRPLEADSLHPVALTTNGRGAMLRANSAWGELNSRYDALLAGNLHASAPEDRHIMFSRCRAWLLYRGYSEELALSKLLDFSQGRDNTIRWRFRIAFGQGRSARLDVHAMMPQNQNAVRVFFSRLPDPTPGNHLADLEPVRLILRPDIEDRSFHEVTKAFAGPEKTWPSRITPLPQAFLFRPSHERALRVAVNAGEFSHEPEWLYMVGRKTEAERGLDPDSDLFSPGYFTIPLRAGQTIELLAQIITPSEPAELPFAELNFASAGNSEADPNFPEREPLLNTLKRALRHFVVRRGDLKTVIAGYPWFLDWGRDTLICARGLIAAGLHEEVTAILRQFARFEQHGTLPNMIRGDDASNRNTSDAPLWFLTACADLSNALNNTNWLDNNTHGKSVRNALLSIAQSYSKATPNGIAMDPKTGLLFSPPHFTWMDTNFPAATPRRGYPIEIQALWYAALGFLQRLDEKGQWAELARRVEDSIARLYWMPAHKYLSDCLHGNPETGAAAASPDDALRPNQLLALTLGAVRDPAMARSILNACAGLLVPGAIRTLADRPVEYPLAVHRDGALLNDPSRPYWGTYQGDEDTRRKPAYHNGTAWTWIFPSFSEAFAMVHGNAGKTTALALLESSFAIINNSCLGQIPEILDGNAPHRPRGCDAQAWGVTELYRVLKLLT